MTWASLKRTCMGKLGLSQFEYYTSSFYDLTLRIEGFHELEKERQHVNYERDRFFTVHLMNLQIESKHRFKTVTDLVRFPWEAKQKAKIIVPLEPTDVKQKFRKSDEYMLKKWQEENG